MQRVSSFRYFLPCILTILVFCFPNLRGQDLLLKINVLPGNTLSVSGEFKDLNESSLNWTFENDYADVARLGERISNLELFDPVGKPLEVKKLSSGEYLALQKPRKWTYQIDLNLRERITDAAHVSWLTKDSGMIRLGDILPENVQNSDRLSSSITIELPINFKIFPSNESQADVSNQNRATERKYSLKDSELSEAVFLIGNNFREMKIENLGDNHESTLSFAIAGDWQFSDAEARAQISAIVNEDQKLFKQMPSAHSQIILLPFPQLNSNPERWRAETRGSTVTMFSGALPYKSMAIQRLNEQLRHEIFHLWIPNGVSLKGNYDWFYEGFSIYQALKIGLKLNQIRFEDYLNTVTQAYQITQLMAESQPLSLIDASNRRWTGNNNLVYAKGLLVAFLCDASLLDASKGKRDLEVVFQKLYRKYNKIEATAMKKSGEQTDGNQAVLSILGEYAELKSTIDQYIIGNSKIDWKNQLKAIGIEEFSENSAVKLRVLEKLNGRQKDLLDKLGYNQWRKLGQQTK